MPGHLFAHIPIDSNCPNILILIFTHTRLWTSKALRENGSPVILKRMLSNEPEAYTQLLRVITRRPYYTVYFLFSALAFYLNRN